MKPARVGIRGSDSVVRFFISSAVAPRIAGTDNKNENVATCFFSRPKSSPVLMVVPLLEIPGMIAKPWTIPIKIEEDLVNLFESFLYFDMNRIQPVVIKAIPTANRF